MGVSIKYKGNTIASASGVATKTVKTSGKYCEGDVLVELNEVVPSGSLSITQNGTYDVTSKASAVVNVSGDTPVYDTPVITVNANGLVSATANGKTGTHQLSASDDADFIAGNIKDGVTLFGVTGTHAGGGNNDNMLYQGINSNGTKYNGIGYKTGTRLNSTGGEASAAGSVCSGFLPCSNAKAIVGITSYTRAIQQYIITYDANFNFLAKAANNTGQPLISYLNSNASAKYFRISMAYNTNPETDVVFAAR